MSRTYKATGINLKSMPLGESDRLLTILTREFGMIRVVAPGARKHQSKLGGRTALFVVNELLVAKGRSLDKITQAETIESYPALSHDLLKLSASQYLAEVVVGHALTDQAQEELFCLLSEHLRRLEQLPKSNHDGGHVIVAHLAQAVFHLLALAGVAPQLQACCITKCPITPDLTNPDWRVGFCIASGGTVSLPLSARGNGNPLIGSKTKQLPLTQYPSPNTQIQINATELTMLQQLAQPKLAQQLQNSFDRSRSDCSWLSVERILRQYTQYHFGRTIRSASLIDNYFESLPMSLSHAATV